MHLLFFCHVSAMGTNGTLYPGYAFPGFPPDRTLLAMDKDPEARVIVLMRIQKALCPVWGRGHRSYHDRKTELVRDKPCGDLTVYLQVELRRVMCPRLRVVR